MSSWPLWALKESSLPFASDALLYNAAAYKAYTASNYTEVQKLHWGTGKISGPIFFALFGYDVWGVGGLLGG